MAASFLGKLLVKIEGDNSDLDKSIKKSEGSVKKFSKLAVGAYALVGVAIIAVGKKFSKLAAQAEEIRSKFNVVFGRTAKEVKEWAKTYSDSVGRSITDTLQFLGSIGDLLKPLGFQKDAVDDLSKVVVTLANDLGSFNDMPTADVMRDIQSAMVGNFEVTKKYGVVLNEAVIKQEAFNRGLFDGKGVVDAQTKAQIALDLIIKGTSDAQGDLIRTQESATNVTLRLEAANKDLGIALGTAINEGLTPMKSITADLVKGLADWITKLNEARGIIDDLKDGTISTDVTLQQLQNTLDILNKRREQAGRGTSQQLKDEIEAVEKLIANYDHVHDRINRNAEARLLYANVQGDAAKRKEIIDETEERAAKELEKLRFDALTDQEKQIELLQVQIDHWALMRSEGADVQELLNELVRQRNELLKEEDEIVLKLHEDQTVMFGTVDAGIDTQIEKAEELNQTYLNLAEDGLGAFASAFADITVQSVSGWDVIKEAGKAAISSFILGLSKMAITEAALAFVRLDIPRGLGFLAAASGAVAAAGFVQNLAEGGVLAPATGGVPAVMAEAGVPEMAMPLNSAATDPFADKIASRINSSVTNNTTNNNSMFSLSDDNKKREAVRQLFPFIIDERQKRGMII